MKVNVNIKVVFDGDECIFYFDSPERNIYDAQFMLLIMSELEEYGINFNDVSSFEEVVLNSLVDYMSDEDSNVDASDINIVNICEVFEEVFR